MPGGFDTGFSNGFDLASRVLLVRQAVPRIGLDIGSGDAVPSAGGAEVPHDGRTMLRLVNGTGGSIIVTLLVPKTVLRGPPLDVADQLYTVPASATRHLKLGSPFIYNQSGGNVKISVAADGITMTAIGID